MAKKAGIQLIERDILILQKLFTARYLTSIQILMLFFLGCGGKIGRRKACEKRLRLLAEHGYVRRIEQRRKLSEGRLPYIYTLAKRGALIVSEELGVPLTDIDYEPRELEENYPFLSHLLATNDFHNSLEFACEREEVKLIKWIDERELRANPEYVTLTSPDGKEQTAAIIPDAMFIYEMVVNGVPKRGVCLVEVDEKTVALSSYVWERRVWGKKVEVYLEYLSSGAYRERFGSYSKKPPRVLTVTVGAKRLRNMLKTTEECGGGTEFWFATQEDAFDPSKILSSPIWFVAGGTLQSGGELQGRGLI